MHKHAFSSNQNTRGANQHEMLSSYFHDVKQTRHVSKAVQQQQHQQRTLDDNTTSLFEKDSLFNDVALPGGNPVQDTVWQMESQKRQQMKEAVLAACDLDDSVSSLASHEQNRKTSMFDLFSAWYDALCAYRAGEPLPTRNVIHHLLNELETAQQQQQQQQQPDIDSVSLSDKTVPTNEPMHVKSLNANGHANVANAAATIHANTKHPQSNNKTGINNVPQTSSSAMEITPDMIQKRLVQLDQLEKRYLDAVKQSMDRMRARLFLLSDLSIQSRENKQLIRLEQFFASPVQSNRGWFFLLRALISNRALQWNLTQSVLENMTLALDRELRSHNSVIQKIASPSCILNSSSKDTTQQDKSSSSSSCQNMQDLVKFCVLEVRFLISMMNILQRTVGRYFVLPDAVPVMYRYAMPGEDQVQMNDIQQLTKRSVASVALQAFLTDIIGVMLELAEQFVHDHPSIYVSTSGITLAYVFILDTLQIAIEKDISVQAFLDAFEQDLEQAQQQQQQQQKEKTNTVLSHLAYHLLFANYSRVHDASQTSGDTVVQLPLMFSKLQHLYRAMYDVTDCAVDAKHAPVSSHDAILDIKDVILYITRIQQQQQQQQKQQTRNHTLHASQQQETSSVNIVSIVPESAATLVKNQKPIANQQHEEKQSKNNKKNKHAKKSQDTGHSQHAPNQSNHSSAVNARSVTSLDFLSKQDNTDCKTQSFLQRQQQQQQQQTSAKNKNAKQQHEKPSLKKEKQTRIGSQRRQVFQESDPADEQMIQFDRAYEEDHDIFEYASSCTEQSLEKQDDKPGDAHSVSTLHSHQSMDGHYQNDSCIDDQDTPIVKQQQQQYQQQKQQQVVKKENARLMMKNSVANSAVNVSPSPLSRDKYLPNYRHASNLLQPQDARMTRAHHDTVQTKASTKRSESKVHSCQDKDWSESSDDSPYGFVQEETDQGVFMIAGSQRHGKSRVQQQQHYAKRRYMV